MLTSSTAGPAFTKKGFSNWKNGREKKKGFKKHKLSDSRIEPVARYVMAPTTEIVDICDLLSERRDI